MNTDTLFYPLEDTVDTGFTIVESFQKDVKNNQPEEETKPSNDSSFIQRFKVQKPTTGMPVLKSVDSSRYNSLEYENWEGRVVAIEGSIIRAKLRSSLPSYCSRIVEVKQSLFANNGIQRDLLIGDEFELSFKQIQKPKGQIENVMSLRMIEVAKVPEDIVAEALEQDLKELSFLFEKHESEGNCK